MSLADYKGKTFEQFAGSPKIVPELIVFMPGPPKGKLVLAPFMARFQAVLTAERGDVYHGRIRVASFIRDDNGHSTVFTIEAYRKRGIGEELVIGVLALTAGLPVISAERTPGGQAFYRKVYDRIQTELAKV